MSLLQGHLNSAWETADRIIEILERQSEQLSDLIGRVEARQDQQDFQRRQLVGVAAANGIADLIFDIPLGLGIRLISAACSGDVPTALTGCAVYLGNPDDDSTLIHVFTYGQRFSNGFAEGEYIPSGGRLVIRFIGQTPGTRCTANVKFMIENPTDTTQVH